MRLDSNENHPTWEVFLLIVIGCLREFVRIDTLARYMEQDELQDQENTHGHDASNSNNSTNK